MKIVDGRMISMEDNEEKQSPDKLQEKLQEKLLTKMVNPL